MILSPPGLRRIQHLNLVPDLSKSERRDAIDTTNIGDMNDHTWNINEEIIGYYFLMLIILL